MVFEDIFLGFLVALAAGALIGIEREQSGALDKKLRLGGVRTFPLLALAGALAALLSHVLTVGIVIGALVVIGVFLAVSYFQGWAYQNNPSVTTEIAAVITFLLGVLALAPGLPLAIGQRYLLIVASAAVVMALLSFKAPLHQAVRRVSADDLYATAKFVILALVVLPLLPDRALGPWQVFNPFHSGLMIVLVAGLSFLGYAAARILGEDKGLAVTGLLGGLVSSTAVTVSLASRVRQSPETLPLAALAILTASTTMFARILVIVLIVDPALLPTVLAPLASMTGVGYWIVLVWYLYIRRRVARPQAVAYRNPFELQSALQFGLIFVAIQYLVKAAELFGGQSGIYLSSLLGGTTDVDAISLSLLRFHLNGGAATITATAIILAVVANTVVKISIAAWLGGWRLALPVLLGLFSALAAGGAVLWWGAGLTVP
ncbi:MAG: MgtC/SapB family protein [Gammaproteobacteria bacterium]